MHCWDLSANTDLTTEKQGWDIPAGFGFQFFCEYFLWKICRNCVIIYSLNYKFISIRTSFLFICFPLFSFYWKNISDFLIVWQIFRRHLYLRQPERLRITVTEIRVPGSLYPFKKNCKFISWRKWEISNLQILKFLLEEVPVLDFLFLSTQEEAPFYGNPISRTPPYPEKPISEKQVEKWEKKRVFVQASRAAPQEYWYSFIRTSGRCGRGRR